MKTVTFGDDALFYRYDRGWQVASRGLRYSSHQPADSDGVALWFVQAVGDPTVPSTQEIGVADYAERTAGRLALALRQGGREFSALDLAGASPGAGWEVSARDLASGHFQGLGRVTAVWQKEAETWYRVDGVAAYDFPVGAYVYFYAPAVVAADNLYIPRRMRVRVEYDREHGWAGPRPAPVAVHRRTARRGKTSFYFAEQVAEVGEGEAATLDAGYYAFAACHPLQDISVVVNGDEYTHHYNEAPAPFAVVVEGADAHGQLLTAGLTVRNEPQPAGRDAAPGPSRLFRDGAPVKADDGREVATPGDIYLARAGGDVYVAWNDAAFDGAHRAWFGQCKLGRLQGSEVRKLFVDRWGPTWHEKPAFELAGGVARFGAALYGGRRRLERRWVRTGPQTVWAAPPQGDVPEGYDGGRAAVFMVAGDRTDLLQAGDVVRLGREAAGAPAPREYVLAEVDAGVRHINEDSPYALDDSWRGITAVFTWGALLEVDRTGLAYDDQVRLEVLGKYVSVAKGMTSRHELWRFRL